ncbi:flagellar hook capping protein [Ligilactobacillus salitolerans]|uniref:Flagellar hook capping protein n=1 Tax=Ligilactobacillus salitolerans TaxID=1808352 RepID=A0A401ITW0_9LACO|nr:flagellar hook capping FlgD N-terminal domain-containing protein [Ligilactobacillus salitolerans]GBG94927.1 flagellar hook capping protein [Ligilactobacillus salitolerans]
MNTDISSLTASTLGSASSASSAANSSSTKKTMGLDMDDFLKILAASMSNPSLTGEGGDSSSSGTDYVSQMAQFATLQQLNDMSSTLNTSLLLTQQQQAFNLMGKEVTVLDETNAEHHGLVNQVSFAGGSAMITVDGTQYSLGAIKDVSEPAEN